MSLRPAAASSSSTSPRASPPTTRSPASRRALRRQDRARRNPRPVRHRAADRPPRPPGDPRAAPVHGAAQDLPRPGPASAASRPPAIATARSPRPASCPRASSSCHRASSASARRRTPRCGSGASAPTGGPAAARASSCPSGRSTVHRVRAALARGRRGRVRDRMLVGNLRPEPDRRPRRRLLHGAAGGCGSGPFSVERGRRASAIPLTEACPPPSPRGAAGAARSPVLRVCRP